MLPPLCNGLLPFLIKLIMSSLVYMPLLCPTHGAVMIIALLDYKLLEGSLLISVSSTVLYTQ